MADAGFIADLSTAEAEAVFACYPSAPRRSVTYLEALDTSLEAP